MKPVIVLVCALGLGAVVGAVVVGTRVFEGTVVDHPYEHGLDWDREHARRAESGLKVRLREAVFATGAARAAFMIEGSAAGTVGDRDVSVRVRRRASAEHEQQVPAHRQPDGSWEASVLLPVAGRWELAVIVARPDGAVELPAEITVREGRGDGAAASPACDLNRGPCSAPLPDGRGSLTLEISPRPVRTMQELEFSVRVDCAAAPCAVKDPAVALTMPGMYMGENTVRLAPAGEPGHFRGRGTIVRCPSGRTLWRAAVSAPPLGEVPFTVETDRP